MSWLAWIIVACFVIDALPGVQWYKGPNREPDWNNPGIYVLLVFNASVIALILAVLL